MIKHFLTFSAHAICALGFFELRCSKVFWLGSTHLCSIPDSQLKTRGLGQCQVSSRTKTYVYEMEPLIPPSAKLELVERVANSPRSSLKESLPSGSGVYMLFAKPGSGFDYLEALAQTGQPVYVGKAEKGTLAKRVAIHLASINKASNLDADGFAVGYTILPDIECSWAEAELINHFGVPVWNGSGFGNKNPGALRTGQKVSAWDSAHPGRGRGEDNPLNAQRDAAEILAKWSKRVSS